MTFINYIRRLNSPISMFAVLKETEYTNTTAIKPLVKMERTKIGKCSSVGTLSAAYDCEIGNFCSIARECYIGGAKHPLDRVSTSGCFYLKDNYTKVCYNENDFNWHSQTKIGNDVWIGFRSTVLGGVTISDGAVIGAGSVVTKDVGPYEIWAGNPARFIRKRFDDKTIELLLSSKWWEWDDVKIKEYSDDFTNVDDFLMKVSENQRKKE
jgi:acetyltransferase-like isoleucine patch superfamily enzyme